MKKLTSLMMVAALAVSITACGATANTNAEASSAADKSTATAEASNETVTITYPEYMIPGAMSDGTDEERMEAAKEFCKVLLDREGVLEAKPSADGSVIATMTGEAHKQLLDDLKASIDKTFDDFFDDDDDDDESDCSDYTYNDDMTVFTVNMDADDYESPYTMEAMLFGISAEGYQALNGVEKPKVTINYVDEKTGNVLGTLTYPDDYDRIFGDAENTLREMDEID
jgi:hypothetical protein